MYPCSARMRATSALKREAGSSTSSCSATRALRMRVSRSAIGSVTVMRSRRGALPARLGQAGDVALAGHLAQADAAEAELAQVGTRPTTAPAAVVVARLVLLLPLSPDELGGLGHR